VFNSDLYRDSSAVNLRRRAFLGFSVTAIAGAAVWSWRKPRLVQATTSNQPPQEVEVVRFSDSGQRLQKVRVPKIVKSEEEWRKQLSPGEFDITRTRKLPALAGTRIRMTRASTAVSAAAMPCSARTPSLNRAPAGPASGNRSRRKTFGPSGTRIMAWCGTQSPAASAMRTWVTCSTMVRHPRACAIA
jgi:hypothetical protein